MRKRLLSALVALCMALTLMPSWAFAENEGIPEPSGNEVIEGLQEEGAKDSPQESGEDGAKDLQKPEENGAEDPLQKPEEDSAGNPLQENQEDGAKDSLQEPEEDGAQNPQPPLEEAEEISLSADLSGLPELDSDALFDRLVSQMLGLEPSAAPAPRKARAAGRAAAFTLNEGEQALYNAILRHATSLTKPSGLATSSKLNIAAADRVTYNDVVSNGQFTSRVFPALMQDHPELFFWFDRHSFDNGGILSHNEGGYFVGTLEMKVTKAYQQNDDEFTFNKSLLTNVQNALNTAQEIVSAAASLDDVGKLEAYRDAVCRMTSYNHDAAADKGGSAVMGEDPWQIIWVFDDDEDTKVVCEGYSKAFQYLCDLTEFDGDVKCYIATGNCGGPHMWNIVVIDGTGYLVDVTNADVDDMEVNGTTYHLDSCLDEFFLMGQTLSSGKTYTARRPAKQFEIDGGTLTVGGGTLTYTYKNDMGFDVDLDLLNLSARDYAVLTGTPVIQKDGAAVSGTLVYASGVTLTAVVDGGASGASYTYQWLKDGNAISGAASGTYALQEGDIGSSITVRVADSATEAFKVSQPVRIISSGPPTAANFTIADPGPGYLVYDGTVKTLTVTSNYGVTPTVSYRKDGRTVTEIRDAGTYQVFVTVPAHAGLEAASGMQIGEITVAKADVELDTVASLSLRPRESKSLFLTPPSLPSGMRLSFSPSSVRNVFTVNTTNGLVTAGTNETTEPVMVTVSVTGSNPNYNTPASKTVPVTVNNLPVPTLTVNLLPNSIPVGGEATITVGASYQNSDGETVTVDSALISVSIDPDSAEIAEIKAGGKILGKQVGTARINVSLPASPDEYAANQGTVELTVTGMEIDPEVTLTPPEGGYVYKGEDWTAEDLTLTVIGYDNDEQPHTLTEDDYTVELSGDDLMNAGSRVLVSVSPKGLNYSWKDGSPYFTSFTISKAPAPAVTLPDVQRHYDYAGADTFELASAPAIAQYAPTGYVLGEVADEDSVLSGPVTVSEEGVLSYTLARMTEAGVNKFAAVPVTIQSRNYEDFSVTVKIVRVALPKAEKFDSCTLTLTQNTDGTYTASIGPEAADAMYRFNGGAWSTERTLQVQGGQPITSAEIYRKGVQNESVDSDVTAADIGSGLIVPPGFTPNGGRFSGTQSVELHAMEADNVKIYYTTDGSEPYTPAEGEGEPQFGTEYTKAFSLSKTTTVKAVVVIYEEDGTTVQAVSETISKTFTRRSSTSGGGGGGTTTPSTTPSAPSSTAKPTTTTKPSTPGVSNSSDATTAAPSATVKDGTASATVSGTIGKDLVDQAVANDSSTVVVAPSISGNPEKTEVTIGSSVVSDLSGRTNADLRVETPAADVTIPSRGLSGLAGRGGSLVVSTSSSGDTYHISVTAGGSTVERVTGGLTVSIPANCTYGTVAMLTKADGSTELIRKSVADAGMVTVPLEGSASITLLDNSKSFGDVPAGNTFAGAVAFVSSREIMNGTGTDTFNPNAPLTRAQLAKILHNLENNPAASASGSFSDVASGAWCAEAVQWAAAQGIVTGYADGTFRPNNYITREQLAVMLYRYAGNPSVRSSELRFSDASMVGGYAQTAMAWATQNGVINGKGGGMLDPKGQATRAQAAQMLFNFVRSAG